MSSYTDLIKKLDQFIRKYYLNKVIRGSLYSVAIIVALFLIFTFLEYEFYFAQSVRKGLFFSFIGISLFSLLHFVFTPMLHYFRLGKRISHEKAASIIGEHFGNVKDKLLNVLQLREQAGESMDNDLVFASIEQKTNEIRLVPFKRAIDLSKNRKYLRYALPPMLILFALLIAAPTVIKDGTSRIIRNNESFEKPAPFHFDILNKDLQAVQFEDYVLNIEVDGSVLPNEAFIRIGEHEYRLKSTGKNTYEHTFKNVQEQRDFKIFSGEIESRPYTLEVLTKPQITNVEILLDYPSYTGRKDETLRNSGDLVIPTGTSIKWKVNTEHTNNLKFKLLSETEIIQGDRVGSGVFEVERRLLRADGYKLFVSNDLLPKGDSVEYAIDIIPDRHPTISAERYVDSTEQKLAYLTGNGSDDYGISKITFNYEIRNVSENTVQNKASELLKTPGKTQSSFDYLLDIDSFNLKPGESLQYYFEIWDNDRVNGSKSARTALMSYEKPTVDEYKAQASANNEDIKEELSEALKESKRIKEEFEALREKLLNKKELGWEDKKELEKLMQQQQALQEQIKNAQQKFQENMQNQPEYEQTPEEIQQKQEQLDEMFEEAQNEEMQDLMEKIQELMEELKREEALEMMDDAQLNQENMEMDMDRLLELFKQLEFEKELTDLANELDELAKEQEALSEETKQEEATEEQAEAEEEESSENQSGDESESSENEGNDQEDQEKSAEEQDGNESDKSAEEKQKEIQEAFEELMEKKDELEEKNESLERPQQMEDTKELEENIQQDMQQSMQQMQKGQKQKASEKQKDASEKMQEMSQQMMASMQSSQMQQMAEDIETLRQLLENLVRLSFDQEDLVNDFARTNAFVPRFAELVQVQDKINRDFKMVEDTLHALATRNDQISGFITDKVRQVKRNIGKSLDHLEEREKSQASDHQRRTMKNLNDLALMLSESMEQMQQQMASMMQGNQMCDNPKPGAGGKPMDVITQGQQKLNQEMKNQAMERQQQGKPGMESKEFAKMAAQQAALRKMLENLQKEKSEQGKADPQIQQIIDEMNKIETDLVNKQLTNEMMKRQKDILTRLLKAEKAERERDWDNKREAQTAQNKERPLPPALEKYIKEREAEIDYFKTVSPDMKPFYRSLVEKYYQSLR